MICILDQITVWILISIPVVALTAWITEEYATEVRKYFSFEIRQVYSPTTQAMLHCSWVEVIAIKIIRWSSQLGWPLRNIHISNYNGYFTFYVDVFFPPSLPRLLSDLTVHMNNTAGVLYQAKTACPSRAPELTPSALEGVSVAHLFIFLFCPIMCLYVLSSGLGCPLRFPLNKYAWFVFASSYL
jgi:hypothetical protein